MTREEAVEVLKDRYLTCVGIGLDNHANRVNEALDMAIEALSEPKNEVRVQEGYCKGTDCKWWNPQVDGCNRCVFVEDEYTHPSAEPSKVDYRTDESANIGTEVNDLISREDAIEAVYKLLWDEPPYCDSEALCRERAKEIVNALPTAAQPERDIPKRVQWTGWKGHRNTRYKCPNCNKPVRNDDVYCHRCGQKLMFPHISWTPYVEGQKQELIVRWDDE